MAVEDGIRIPYHFWVRLNDAVVVVAVLVEECLEECHGLMPLLIVERVWYESLSRNLLLSSFLLFICLHVEVRKERCSCFGVTIVIVLVAPRFV